MKTNTLVLLILCTVILLAGALLTQHFISGLSSTLPPSAEEQIEMQENIPPAQDTVTEKVDEEIALANRLYTPNIQLPAEDKWELSLCDETILPQHNYQGIFCKTKGLAQCAFFPNGLPFFCQELTDEGKTAYATNPWGSSVMRTTYRPDGKILSLFYFANNILRREEHYDYDKNLVMHIWWMDQQIELHQMDTKGRTLNKFYFTPDKPYVQYPDGNDMGEINGEWQQIGNKFFIDGKFLYELPERISVPNICMIFDGACEKVPTQP